SRHNDPIRVPVPPIEAKMLKCEQTVRGSRIEVELDQVVPSIVETLELVVAARNLNTFFVCRSSMVSGHRRGRGFVLSLVVGDEKFSESAEIGRASSRERCNLQEG